MYRNSNATNTARQQDNERNSWNIQLQNSDVTTVAVKKNLKINLLDKQSVNKIERKIRCDYVKAAQSACTVKLLNEHQQSRRHERRQAWAWARGGTCLPLWKCIVFLCISSYSKTLSRRIIYALFSQPVIGFWGQRRPDPHQGSIHGPRWGTLVARHLICLKKILWVPMTEWRISV